MVGLKAVFLKKLSMTAYAMGRYAITRRKTRAGAVVPKIHALRSVEAIIAPAPSPCPLPLSGERESRTLADPLHLLADLGGRLVHHGVGLHALDIARGQHPAGQVLVVEAADVLVQLLAVPVVERHALGPHRVEELQHVHTLLDHRVVLVLG